MIYNSWFDCEVSDIWMLFCNRLYGVASFNLQQCLCIRHCNSSYPCVCLSVCTNTLKIVGEILWIFAKGSPVFGTRSNRLVDVGNAVIGCEIKLFQNFRFQPLSTYVRNNFFQRVKTCPEITSKLFQRLTAAQKYFSNMFRVAEIISGLFQRLK